MASSYTTNLRLTLPVQGELAASWGNTVNTGVTSLVDAAISGTASIALTGTTYTLTSANGATDEARQMFLTFTGTPGGAATVTCPTLSKLYYVTNNTNVAVTLKTALGTGISVPVGVRMALYCDGTNVIDGATYLSSVALGTALPATSGGTGVTTSTGTGNNVLSSLPSFGTTIGVGGATASASGSGISFPATQSASTNANTLDDYEEGTWTPTLNISGATTGITYTARSGSYVKVGRIVYVSLNIQLSNKGSLSGDVTVTGLPFTTNSVADGYAYFGAADYSAMSGATAHIYAQALNNSTTIYLCNGSLGGAGIDVAQETNLFNSSSFNLTGTYITA